MKISHVVGEYLALKRSMGMRFQSASYKLNAFSRRVGDIDIETITPGSVLAFLNGTSPTVTPGWHDKLAILRGFYRFAIARRYVTSSPLPVVVPKPPPPFVAYIYSLEEIRRMLEATKLLASKRSRLRESTFRTLFLMLFATGMRVGEALALNLGDVDLLERVLTIRESKFYKSRLVPIGPKLAEELRRFLPLRRELVRHERTDPFFASGTGRRFCYGHVRGMFGQVRKASGVRRNGARYQPRLHDLRHTFAVRRLVTWYREGADVQRLLPKLSTYLGHVDIAATQKYLQMIPELLQEANRRFESYALEVDHA